MLLSDLKILIPDYISIFALMFFFIVLKERILVKRGCIERKWNVLRFAVNSIKTGTTIKEVEILLSPGGTRIASLSNDTSIKILNLGSSEINDACWDLIVTAKGIYGYIPRDSWK